MQISDEGKIGIALGLLGLGGGGALFVLPHPYADYVGWTLLAASANGLLLLGLHHFKRGFFWPIIIGAIALTWAVCGWQTWMWFHPPTPPTQLGQTQGYTQAQLDDAKAKAKQDQLDQDKKDAAQQSADAVAKATATLRAQVAQLQSDTPVSIDKLPTSLTLSFKGGNVEQIGNAPNVVWTKMFGWQQSLALFGTGGVPSWVIVIVFKKPIAYKTLCFDGHNSSISTPAAEKNPYYAIITFDPGPLDALVGLRAANECPK